MLDFIEGACLEKRAHSIVLERAGFGLEVFVPAPTLQQLSLKKSVRLFTHLHLTEKEWTLYGFLHPSERSFFLKVSQVTGVGPRKALELLRASLSTAEKWIQEGDAAALSTSPGIGKKLAQRIIVELQGKLVRGEPLGGELTLVSEALQKLGYQPKEVQQAIQKLAQAQKQEEQKPPADPETLIKQALQWLAR